MTTGTLDGKVAFITGAARGMGRAHAVKLAGEGADIIAIDVCAKFDSTDYPGATADDLATTVKRVERQGRRILAHQVDVRDGNAVNDAVTDGVRELVVTGADPSRWPVDVLAVVHRRDLRRLRRQEIRQRVRAV